MDNVRPCKSLVIVAKTLSKANEVFNRMINDVLMVDKDAIVSMNKNGEGFRCKTREGFVISTVKLDDMRGRKSDVIYYDSDEISKDEVKMYLTPSVEDRVLSFRSLGLDKERPYEIC